MRLFKWFAVSIISTMFPLFVALNSYFFLVQIAPEFNFLGLELRFLDVQAQQIAQCPYGGVNYFGLKSLFNWVDTMDGDRFPLILQGALRTLESSFFVFKEPAFSNLVGSNDNVLNILKVLYYVLGVLNQPLYVASWGAYTIAQIAIQVYDFVDKFILAFAGMYNSVQCHPYPTAI